MIGFYVDDLNAEVSDDTLGRLFDTIYALADIGDFDTLSARLRESDVKRMPTLLLIAMIRYSFVFREHLPSWNDVARRVRKEIAKRDPARVSRLLHGLP